MGGKLHLQFLVRRQTSSFVQLKFKFKEHGCPPEAENSSLLTSPQETGTSTLQLLGTEFCQQSVHPWEGFLPQSLSSESSLPFCKLTNTFRKKKKNIVYHKSGTAVNTLQKLIHFCLHFIGKESGTGRGSEPPPRLQRMAGDAWGWDAPGPRPESFFFLHFLL